MTVATRSKMFIKRKRSNVLRSVIELLEDEKRWTQHEEARDASGNGCAARSDAACSWCVLGAFMKVLNCGRDDALEFMEYTLGGGVIEWNDWPIRTHEDVMTVLNFELKSYLAIGE